MIDYYSILEINENASKETIEKVHKLLVKKYHPDLQEQSKKTEYEEKMKIINEAYAVLTNPVQRESYDKELKEYRMQQIMEEIRQKQQEEMQQQQYTDNVVQDVNNVEVYQEQYVQQQSPFNINDEEIRRQAQVYYDELYKQYLYYNGYVQENFETKAKRYITVILTIAVLIGIMYVIYKIPYFNEFLKEAVYSNEILKQIFGRFFLI